MNKDFGSLLFQTAARFTVAFAVLFLDGFVLSLLWLWYIVPVFGLTAITVPVATGLLLMLQFVSGSDPSTGSPEEGPSFTKELADRTFYGVCRTLSVLGAGLFVKSFM